MIKVCKKKAVRRWNVIGNGIWYAWNISFFVSIIHMSLAFSNIIPLDYWLMINMVNACFSGMFMIQTENIFSKIKEKQKLFGWDESC